MAKRPRQRPEISRSHQPAGVDAEVVTAASDRQHAPSGAASEAIRRLARLMGRQIARELKRASS